jgi:Glycosyltransferase like family
MIAFGCAITKREIYERYAEPGLRLAAEPDSLIVAHGTAGSLFRNYNLIIDRVADRDDLEALVLVHQDAEIVDRDFCSTVRDALGDPDVAIVGCAGAIGVRSIAWWEGAVTWAGFTHRYAEHGGGDIPALTWDPDDIPPEAELGEVETIDGFVIVMSPWAVRELRFDESLGELHGYDLDLCLQARAAGKKVVTADFRAIHHHSLELIGNMDGWVNAHIAVAEKWDETLRGDGLPGQDWRPRALRAEADAAAARMMGGAAILAGDARAAHDAGYIADLERDIETMRSSLSWRLTAPLRALSRLLRRRRG